MFPNTEERKKTIGRASNLAQLLLYIAEFHPDPGKSEDLQRKELREAQRQTYSISRAYGMEFFYEIRVMTAQMILGDMPKSEIRPSLFDELQFLFNCNLAQYSDQVPILAWTWLHHQVIEEGYVSTRSEIIQITELFKDTPGDIKERVMELVLTKMFLVAIDRELQVARQIES